MTIEQQETATQGEALMRRHFEGIAPRYSGLRTLDVEPILHIAERLPRRPGLHVADVGCGDGRYTCLLFEALLAPRLICVDSVEEMLFEAWRRLHAAGARDVRTVCCTAEQFVPEPGSLDALLSFNAVHHFALGSFLDRAEVALRPGGRLFVYTRLPEQNARTIWGRFFPGFAERETRLYTLEELRGAVEERPGLRFESSTPFRHPRVAQLSRLCEQARERHYSTFALYEPEELESSLRAFEEAIRREFADPGRVRWVDENVLIEVCRR